MKNVAATTLKVHTVMTEERGVKNLVNSFSPVIIVPVQKRSGCVDNLLGSSSDPTSTGDFRYQSSTVVSFIVWVSRVSLTVVSPVYHVTALTTLIGTPPKRRCFRLAGVGSMLPSFF